MKKQILKFREMIFFRKDIITKLGTGSSLLLLFFIFNMVDTGFTQDIRWLRVSELQSPINEVGAEWETEFNQTGSTSNYFSWPAQYNIDQTLIREKGLWIGCRNFNDPVLGTVKNIKVIGSGPQSVASPDQIFPQEIKLIGKYSHPTVTVDGIGATQLSNFDLVDEYDENLLCDRMVYVKFNTSIGITVTKKVMVFSNSEHGNYLINDYVFKNTGIINAAGNVREQTLQDVWFYWISRYAFAGVSVGGDGVNSTWGAFPSVWGNSMITHSFGQDPNNPEFSDNDGNPMRGFFQWYGPSNESVRLPAGYNGDWGCPKLDQPNGGTLGSAKYAGCITLHADSDPQNQNDDLNQPRTTWYLSPDIPITTSTAPSQYDDVFMADRWAAMTEGHPSPEEQHDILVDGIYPITWSNPRRQSGGGIAQGQGFGPYTLAPGDSIHIVFGEGASGISWKKGREVGGNWLQWFNGTGTPPLIMPNGSERTDGNFNEYKRAWVVDAGRDSILKTFRNAIDNYNSGYGLPQPPPPPSEFSVSGGGDRIRLTWSNNAASDPHFGGYVIYRSRGNVLDWTTVYEKVFETSDPTVTSFDDTSAARGFDYFYYIQSKDDGTQVPGTTLYSSLFWTITNIGAVLGRPAADFLMELRVVPNPYDIRARFFQFGDQSQYDRITFYGLPPICKLKIFTERGDLIWEKDHTSTTGDEIWDSKTSSGQIVSSGIYILYVEVPRDIYAEEDRFATHDIYDDNLNVMFRTGDLMFRAGDLIFREGDSKYRKFVIIR